MSKMIIKDIVIISIFFVVMFALTSYIDDFYKKCDGKVIRGLKGFVCIESAK